MSHDTRKRKQQYEIKDALLAALEKYPDNTSQLSKRIGTNKETAERHLEELEDLHKVQLIKKQVGGEEKELWELVR